MGVAKLETTVHANTGREREARGGRAAAQQQKLARARSSAAASAGWTSPRAIRPQRAPLRATRQTGASWPPPWSTGSSCGRRRRCASCSSTRASTASTTCSGRPTRSTCSAGSTAGASCRSGPSTSRNGPARSTKARPGCAWCPPAARGARPTGPHAGTRLPHTQPQLRRHAAQVGHAMWTPDGLGILLLAQFQVCTAARHPLLGRRPAAAPGCVRLAPKPSAQRLVWCLSQGALVQRLRQASLVRCG